MPKFAGEAIFPAVAALAIRLGGSRPYPQVFAPAPPEFLCKVIKLL